MSEHRKNNDTAKTISVRQPATRMLRFGSIPAWKYLGWDRIFYCSAMLREDGYGLLVLQLEDDGERLGTTLFKLWFNLHEVRRAVLTGVITNEVLSLLPDEINLGLGLDPESDLAVIKRNGPDKPIGIHDPMPVGTSPVIFRASHPCGIRRVKVLSLLRWTEQTAKHWHAHTYAETLAINTDDWD